MLEGSKFVSRERGPEQVGWTWLIRKHCQADVKEMVCCAAIILDDVESGEEGPATAQLKQHELYEHTLVS